MRKDITAALRLTWGAFILMVVSGTALAGDLLPDPQQPGPYPVGVTTMVFVDHSRVDASAKGPRALMTEIWYPATDDTQNLPKNKLSDFFLQNRSPELALILFAGFGVDLAEADKEFQNFAVRDARICDGHFPLLLFSHGNGGLRMQNAFWCEHMASHGYIVMAPDHTGNCAVTFVAGVPVAFDASAEARSQSSVDRPKDLSFLIDMMDRMNKGDDSRFLGRVDMERIGAAGHSFGGFTCTWLINTDARVKAIAPMAGVAEDRTNFDCPVLLFYAVEDATLGAGRQQLIWDYYENSAGPRYWVEFKDGGHFSFTEMHQLKPDFGDGVGQGKRVASDEPVEYPAKEVVFPLVNGYSAAFFGRHLKGQEGYAAHLAVNHDEATLIYQSDPE